MRATYAGCGSQKLIRVELRSIAADRVVSGGIGDSPLIVYAFAWCLIHSDGGKLSSCGSMRGRALRQAGRVRGFKISVRVHAAAR